MELATVLIKKSEGGRWNPLAEFDQDARGLLPNTERLEMSYLDVVDHVTLFRSLHSIDVEMANKVRAKRCSRCRGPLHWGKYRRKPRGEGMDVNIPEELHRRLSLCCGWCRRRTLPPSCLYFGRKVFWGCVVMLLTAAVQGLGSHTMAELCARFEVSRRTVKRWVSFFEVVFPWSAAWQRLRGRVGVEVRNEDLPRGLVAWFLANSKDGQSAVVSCLEAAARASAG